METCGWNESQLRKYKIPTLTPVPKYAYDDPKVMELITKNVSIILLEFTVGKRKLLIRFVLVLFWTSVSVSFLSLP